MKQMLRVFFFSLLIGALGLSTNSLHAMGALEGSLVEGIGKAFADGAEVGLADGMENTLANAMKQSIEADTGLMRFSKNLETIEGQSTEAFQAAQTAMKESYSTFAKDTLTEMRGAEGNYFEISDGKITGFTQEGQAAFKEAISGKLSGLSDTIEQNAITQLQKPIEEGGAGLSQEAAEGILNSIKNEADVVPVTPDTALEEGATQAERALTPEAQAQGVQEATQAAEALKDLPAVQRTASVTERLSQFGGTVKKLGSDIKDGLEGLVSTKKQYEQFTETQEAFESVSNELDVANHTMDLAVLNPGEDLVVGTLEKGCTVKGSAQWGTREVQLTRASLRDGVADVEVVNGDIVIKPKGTSGEVEITISKNDFPENATGESMQSFVKRALKDGDVKLVVDEKGAYKIEISDGAECDAKFVSKDNIPTQEHINALEATKEARYNEMLKQSTNIRKMVRFVSRLGGKAVVKITGILKAGGELLLQALVFTLPNILYQQTVDAQQSAALLETIGVIQEFGPLYLQIPPALISTTDPLQSLFVYVQVPDNNGGNPYPKEYFTSQILANATFFVTYGGSYGTWGATYIGSSNFTGQMVCLNNGWIFTGDGISVDAQNPVAFLCPAGQKTVQTFFNTLVAGQGNKYEHNVRPTDWIPLGMQKAFGFDKDAEKGTVALPAEYEDLFATYPVTDANNALPGASAFTRPPILFSQAIERFRTPIQLQNFARIRLRQIRGLGFRGVLLSDKLDLSNPAVKTALDDLKKAQDDYNAVMSGDPTLTNGSTTGNIASQENKEQENAAASLASAQQNVAQQLKGIGVDDDLLGFHPEDDPCTRGIYIYEIVNDGSNGLTPMLAALAKKSDLPIDPTEYVVCLDGASQIVPLYIPAVVKENDESASTGAQAGKGTDRCGVQLILNPNIAYIVSLTTGIAYQKNASLNLVPVLKDGAVDYTKATNALNSLMKLLSAESKGIINQIIGMANYFSKEIAEGPFGTTSGYLLEQVPLKEFVSDDAAAIQAQALADMGSILSGVVSASGAAAKLNTFSSDTQKQMLPNVYIYKVTNQSGQGALSYNGSDGVFVDIPDYVVPVITNATSTKFQIVPLGINPLTGALGSSGTFLFSLVTGRVYDSNYSSLPSWYTVDVIPRTPKTYFPIDGSTSGAYEGLGVGNTSVTINLPTQDGSVKPVPVRMFPKVPLSTAYMPTVFNPYNRIFSSSPDAQKLQLQYDQVLQNIAQKSQQLSALQAAFAGVPISVVQWIFNSAQNGQVSAATLKAAGFPNPDAMASTANTYLSNNPNVNYSSLSESLTSLQSSLHALELTMNTTPGVMIPRTVTMNIPPLYFLFFSNFEICTSGGGAVVLSIPASADSGTSLAWASMQGCQSGQALGKSDSTGVTYLPLAALLPPSFSGFNLSQIINPSGQNNQSSYYDNAIADNKQSYMSVLAAYEKWTHGQEATNYWSQTALMGPINFTIRTKNNVYITAQRSDVAGGYFFYNATGFPATSLFVCATGPQDGNISSMSQLADIGRPYQPGDGTGVYLIDIGTGQVYRPIGNGPSATLPYACAGKSCTLQLAGPASTMDSNYYETDYLPLTLDPDQVVRMALTNQGHAPSSSGDILSGLPSGLQDRIKNAQAAGKEQKANMKAVTFAGMSLTISDDQINRGSYIYSNSNGTDYFAVFVTDPLSSSKLKIKQIGAAPITNDTSCIVSLVTGILYYKVGAPVTDYFVGAVEQPNLLPALLFRYVKQGAYQKTGSYLAVDPGNDIIQKIQDLNAQYLAKLAAEKAAYVPTALDTVPVLTPAMVASAVSAGGASNSLYTIGLKYYTKTQVSSDSKNTDGSDTTVVTDVWFDFNATQDTKDAGLGIYYMQYKDPSGTVSYKPMNPVSGFALDALRLHYGVVVGADGKQSLTLPIDHLSIPLAPNETSLVPIDGNGVPQFGQDGGYMKYQNKSVVDADSGLTYWYYYHTNIKCYFVLIQDTVGSVVEDDVTVNPNAQRKTIFKPAYFADFLSGDEYYLNGQPRMREVTISYVRVEKPFVWPVITTAPQLPLAQLASAQPVAGRTDIYLVDGKYYAKEVIPNGPMIDQNGNVAYVPNTEQLIRATITRWIDFNGNKIGGSVVGKDSQVASYYQILTDPVSKQDQAIPIQNVRGSDLKYLRRVYGVLVAQDGTQSLVDPVTNGVDLRRPLFVWSDPESYQSFGAFNIIGDLDDSGRLFSYLYVPYYSVFKFVDSTGTTVTEVFYGQDTSSSPIKLSVMKKTYPLTDFTQFKTITLQDFTDIDTAASIYRKTISDLAAAGNVLFAVTHYISQDGTSNDAKGVSEGMLSPKTFTIDGVHYVEAGDYSYQTVFSDAPGDKGQDDALLKGIPFVADSKGSRPTGSISAPTGASDFGTPMCGVLDNQSLMLALTTNNQGLFYRTHDPKVGVPNTYTAQALQPDGSYKQVSLAGSTVPYSTQSNKSVSAGYYFTLQTQGNSQESVYVPETAYLPDQLLEALSKDVNVIFTSQGSALESRINISDLQSAKTNLATGSMSQTYIKSVTVPDPKILYQVPTLDVVTAYYQSNPTKYSIPTTALDSYNKSIGLLTPGMYVDYVNGVVFSVDGNTLYPTGLEVGSDGLKVIHDQFSGAVAGIQNGVPQLIQSSAIPVATGG